MSEKNMTIDGEYIARYLKYFLQLKNPYVVYKLPVDKVSPKNIYAKYKAKFDLLATICNKYDIDSTRYLDFFVNKFNKFEKDIDVYLVSLDTINKYVESLQISELHNRIYNNFLRSVDNIVDDCIKLNFNSVVDYLRYLISSRKIASYYAAGRISIYYFAAIPKFKNVIEKLDNISRDEFHMLYERYDKYHYDVNEAFLKLKNIKINPIKYTNDAILNAKNV